MTQASLTALSPLDGRYAHKVDDLRPIFSEQGLIHFRVLIEIRWLQMLANTPEIAEVPSLSTHANKLLESIIENFNPDDATRVKNIEKTTNHDVKAVEYFIKEKIAGNEELNAISEFIHFACTSEDINNLSYALMLQTARKQCLLPAIDNIIKILCQMAHDHAGLAMLGRTHGQPATPTTVGKEMANFVNRLRRERQAFSQSPILGKFNGAVGNYNAHQVTYPEIDWSQLNERFVSSLGIEFNHYTAQIEPHDFIADYNYHLMRINTILIDLSRDIWAYISVNYFKQRVVATEVGSSTMPHKVNPINFENAEGNLSLANAILGFLAGRLPTSRWQRDLVDSTLLRNLGVAIGHSMIAFDALQQGLNKLSVNDAIIKRDIDDHWEVITEAVQTVMRRYGIANPYEQLKNFSRGKALDEQSLKQFIAGLGLKPEVKDKLLALTPSNYIGLAKELAENV